MTIYKKLATAAIATLALSACGSSSKEPKSVAQPGFEPMGERADPSISDEVASDATTPILPQDIVYFTLDSATLSEAAEHDLMTVAAWMKENPERYIVIEAHSDEQGADEHNMDLSKRRGLAVLDRLLANGVDRKFVILNAHGERHPIDGPDVVNRRALIYATERPTDKPAS